MFSFAEVLARLESVVKLSAPALKELEGTVTHLVLQAVAKEVEALSQLLEAKLADLDKKAGS